LRCIGQKIRTLQVNTSSISQKYSTGFFFANAAPEPGIDPGPPGGDKKNLINNLCFKSTVGFRIAPGSGIIFFKIKLNMTDQIAYKIRRLREIKNYSQDYISQKLGVSIRAYSKIENGESKLSVDRFFEIAVILNLKPEDILNFNEDAMFPNTTGKEKVNNPFVRDEKTTYEKYIRHLEEEISFLRNQMHK
jgi:transcriptional regulator with XRE-family HTH domain